MERTHVSSVTQRAFFQPMSPQALQQHRGTHHSRPGSQTVNPRSYEEEYDEDQSQTHTEFSGPASVRTRPHFAAPALPPPPTQSQLQQPATADSRTTGFRKSITHQDSSSSPLTGKTFELSENASLQAPPTPRSGYRFPGEKASSFVDPADDEITLAPESVASNDKNYKHFKAGRLFFFGGLLQTSKDRPFVLVTLIAILVPAALFFAYPGRLLWTQSSGGPAVTIIFALIFLHCMSAFAHASFSDPGILPHNIDRNPPLKADADPLTLGPPQERWVAVPSPMAKMGAFEVPCKFCKTCCIWRPPRCYHCGICDTCVDTLDHHCVWLNNCIGRRNYVHFLTFLVSLIVLSVYLAAASIAQVATVSGVTLGQAANDTAGQVALALFAYGILGACYPASLLGYHVFLMARGETTREYLNNRKRPATERYRPFSTGSWGRNLISVVCRPVPPVALRFSGRYVVGDQRFEKGL